MDKFKIWEYRRDNDLNLEEPESNKGFSNNNIDDEEEWDEDSTKIPKPMSWWNHFGLKILQVLRKKEMKIVLRVKLLQPHAHMLRGEAGGTKIKIGYISIFIEHWCQPRA